MILPPPPSGLRIHILAEMYALAAAPDGSIYIGTSLFNQSQIVSDLLSRFPSPPRSVSWRLRPRA